MTEDPGLVEAATQAIWEAGAAVQQLGSPDQLDLLPSRPRVIVCGHDVDPAAANAVARLWPECRLVRAALGENARAAGECLVLPRSARQLTRLVEESHRPPGVARRVGVIGAHGGAGASCLAAAAAMALAARQPARATVRLASLNRAGAPLAALLALDGSRGWAEAFDLPPGGAEPSPQTVNGVELLSPDAPPPEVPAWRVRRALEAWEARAPGGTTVLDAGPGAPGGTWRAASWADQRVVVARADPAGAAALAAVALDLAELGLDFCVAVRAVRGGLGAGKVADGIGGRVFAIGDERAFTASLVHGLIPGDRAKGKLARAANELAEWLGPGTAAGPSAPAERRARGTSRRSLPAFDPAAFAEEW
jgi:hypothetical protein